MLAQLLRDMQVCATLVARCVCLGRIGRRGLDLGSSSGRSDAGSRGAASRVSTQFRVSGGSVLGAAYRKVAVWQGAT